MVNDPKSSPQLEDVAPVDVQPVASVETVEAEIDRLLGELRESGKYIQRFQSQVTNFPATGGGHIKAIAIPYTEGLKGGELVTVFVRCDISTQKEDPANG